MKVINVLSITPEECGDMVKTVEEMRSTINNLEPGPIKSKLRTLSDNLYRDLTYREKEYLPRRN